MIVLFTDGEDTTIEKGVSPELLLAKVSPELGWDVVALGTATGAIVPGMIYDGRQVTSYMQKELLMSLAKRGNGKFYEERAMTLSSISDNILADMAAKARIVQRDSDAVAIKEANYLPLLAAFLLILIALLLPQGRVK